MKHSKIIIIITSLVTSILLNSCTTTDILKRHYRNGFTLISSAPIKSEASELMAKKETGKARESVLEIERKAEIKQQPIIETYNEQFLLTSLNKIDIIKNKSQLKSDIYFHKTKPLLSISENTTKTRRPDKVPPDEPILHPFTLISFISGLIAWYCFLAGIWSGAGWLILIYISAIFYPIALIFGTWMFIKMKLNPEHYKFNAMTGGAFMLGIVPLGLFLLFLLVLNL